MGIFLDSKNPYENFREMASDIYFVDKSMLIQELIPYFGRKNRYFCITRPRRFGKMVMANMVGAFFGKAVDSHHLFDHLRIADGKDAGKNPDYHKHLNQHHVIYIDFGEVPRNCTDYRQYIDRIQNGINNDLGEAYPDFDIHEEGTTWDILTDIFQKTGSRFLFIMDEWDALFHMSFTTEEDKRSYLLFLKSLLKDKVYVKLAYMTGILPIAKYSDGSELNMFTEYNMATSERFSKYFGFTDSEVDKLFTIYKETTKEPKLTREGLSDWYDGYRTASGSRIYNPRSIVCAFTDNQLRNYWTSSGTYDSIFSYIKDNVTDIQDDLALLFAGGSVPAHI